MDVETKMARLASFSQETITHDELRSLLETNEHPIAYDGFEPSGIAPVHFGLLRAKNLKIMLEVGIKPKLYLADYFGYINNKFEGDMEKIQTAGRYFVEVWKAAGIDTEKVEMIWASKLMDNMGYWDRFLKIGKATTIERIKRAVTIAGRKENEKLSAAQLFYPAMQVTDIFEMKVDIPQMGMDQRRANILAREVAHKYGWKVPIPIHHKLVLGLQGMPKGTEEANEETMVDFKMSKSNPKSAIYVHDSYDELKKKISGAYCPEKEVEGNPMINYVELLIINNKSDPIMIDRPEKFGGKIEFNNYLELVDSYAKGGLHPADLKSFVTEELEKRIKPIREYFEKNQKAKALYDEVKSYRITR
jgi:tyrosyl-tRNA synthetase